MNKILLVDDEKILRVALSKNLKKSGYDITTAPNGEEAIVSLMEKPYDIIITDYYLEAINGIELIAEAKKLYPKIKSIIFSGHIFDDTNKFPVNGADSFLAKPIGLNDLLGSIQKLFTDE